MVSFKLFFAVLALCAIQMKPCSAGLVENILNATFTNIVNGANEAADGLLKSVQGGITQAENLVAKLTEQANQVLSSSQGPLQNILKDFTNKVQGMVNNTLEYTKNRTICVQGQEQYAKNITLQAGKDIFDCTQLQVQQATENLADMTSLNDQAVALVRTIPTDVSTCMKEGFPNAVGCIGQHILTFNGKIAMLASALASDVGKLGVQVVSLPSALTRCGVDQISKATTKVGELITSTGNCFENVAQNS